MNKWAWFRITICPMSIHVNNNNNKRISEKILPMSSQILSHPLTHTSAPSNRLNIIFVDFSATMINLAVYFMIGRYFFAEISIVSISVLISPASFAQNTSFKNKFLSLPEMLNFCSSQIDGNKLPEEEKKN